MFNNYSWSPSIVNFFSCNINNAKWVNSPEMIMPRSVSVVTESFTTVTPVASSANTKKLVHIFLQTNMINSWKNEKEKDENGSYIKLRPDDRDFLMPISNYELSFKLFTWLTFVFTFIVRMLKSICNCIMCVCYLIIQEIWANAHETRDSILSSEQYWLTSGAGQAATLLTIAQCSGYGSCGGVVNVIINIIITMLCRTWRQPSR